MSGGSQALIKLSDAIRDGSFPDSNVFLSTELSSDIIPQLLNDISQTRQGLSQDIQKVSRSLGGGIDDWIAKAKRVQDDIAKCKKDARSIVDSHARIEAQRSDIKELHQKSRLLNAEIDFTTSLQDQLQSAASIARTLKGIEDLLSHEQAGQAANALKQARDPISIIRGPQVLSIVRKYEAELIDRTKRQLEAALYNDVVVTRNSTQCSIEIKTSSVDQSLDPILDGLSDLQALKGSLDGLSSKIEWVMLSPLRKKSRAKFNEHSSHGARFQASLGTEAPSVAHLIHFMMDFWSFLQSQLPRNMVVSLAEILLPKMVGTLLVDWMTPSIPVQFHELGRLDELQQNASELARYLEVNQWPGVAQLSDWIEQAPRIWLTKRKAETLDAVRKAFAASRGSLQQVERTERQKAKPNPPGDDDWNTSWDEDNHEDDRQMEDDTSGWGFEEDEPPSPKRTKRDGNGAAESNKDDSDAWAWGDDDQDQHPAGKTKARLADKANGMPLQMEESQEVVLTELYSITDIPDHLVEVIGRDLQDSFTLAEQQHTSLQGVAPSKGLLALPTFALAMFRAIAPTEYSRFPSAGNMNLYNDALYITEKLRSMNPPEDMASIDQDCKAMERFARSAYAKEMDVQRTILTDLLDGAQGFAGCTQPLYAREIENAVGSTVDRVRQVYQDWKPILSTSALLQSIGALVTLVIGKVITDIEEVEEISAPQSEKLVSYCSQVSALEDLFLAKPPGVHEGDEDSVPMTAVYVSNWLKFQYLINILESSLVDIKFLWTEGELSLEFNQDEVIELIEALFQESSHRRSAIAAIRGHRTSSIR